jgi:hypothetical protein
MAFITPRSLQPGGLQHRRQRGRKLRWGALPEVRRHQQPRAGAWRWCCPMAASPAWAAACRRCGGLDLRGVFIGSEGTLGIATADHAAAVARPRDAWRCCWRISAAMEAAGEAVRLVTSAGVLPAGMEMMASPLHRRGQRFLGRGGVSPRGGGGAADRARWPCPRGEGSRWSWPAGCACEAGAGAGARGLRRSEARARLLEGAQERHLSPGAQLPQLLPAGRRGARAPPCPRCWRRSSG